MSLNLDGGLLQGSSNDSDRISGGWLHVRPEQSAELGDTHDPGCLDQYSVTPPRVLDRDLDDCRLDGVLELVRCPIGDLDSFCSWIAIKSFIFCNIEIVQKMQV